MSLIMTEHGWKRLAPRHCVGAGHTPSMLEAMGLENAGFGTGYDITDQFCEAIQRFRKLNRGHPHWVDRDGMHQIMGAKALIPGFHVKGYPH